MRKVRDVLRLKHTLGMSFRQMSEATGIGKTVVKEYVRRAGVIGITWPVPEEIDDAELEQRLFPVSATKDCPVSRIVVLSISCWQKWSLKIPKYDNLVSMTRTAKSKMARALKPRRHTRDRRPGRWLLQDAKARFSELVRRVRSEGPQHVIVHGRDEVVVIAAEDFRRLDLTGEALVAAIQASPYRDIDIEPRRAPMPVRDVTL
jgi:prevent-host-death family protein